MDKVEGLLRKFKCCWIANWLMCCGLWWRYQLWGAPINSKQRLSNGQLLSSPYKMRAKVKTKKYQEFITKMVNNNISFYSLRNLRKNYKNREYQYCRALVYDLEYRCSSTFDHLDISLELCSYELSCEYSILSWILSHFDDAKLIYSYVFVYLEFFFELLFDHVFSIVNVIAFNYLEYFMIQNNLGSRVL